MNDVKQILVLSDTHGNITQINALKSVFSMVDKIYHLGDYVRDAQYIRKLCDTPVLNVKGNCDYGDTETVLYDVVLGHKIMLTHGHKYGVKFTLGRLALEARENGAEMALFGHTHRTFLEMREGVMLLNPGSLGEPRGEGKSYAVLEVTGAGIEPRIRTIT